ncbi:MAG: hypothetical protein KDC49_06435 [Saprospiraceae bacterium]|nr:hypothetical protein [Saprospiraceae bacterium]
MKIKRGLKGALAALFIFIGTMALGQEIIKEVSYSNRNLVPTSLRNNYHSYEVHPESIQKYLDDQGGLNLELPIGRVRKYLALQQVQVLSKDARLITDVHGHLPFPEILVFRGYVLGEEENSMVSLVVNHQQMYLSVYDDEGVFELSPSDNYHQAYFTQDYEAGRSFACKADQLRSYGENLLNSANQNNNRSVNSSCVEIYFEIDNTSYNENGSNTTSVTSWFVNLFNQVALQYQRIDIPLKVSGLKIYTQPDPYRTKTTSETALYAFRDSMNKQGFPGQLAHLLIGRGIGGGIAYLNGLCNSYTSYAVSGNMNSGVVGYPSYSWNVNVIAHELGHNFGSPHTHDCAWNGNNTAIDGCATSPGSCPNGPVPSSAEGGTIMSYCHLNGTGIKPINGFGPQPAELIYSRYLLATCNAGNDCSELPPTNDVCFAARPIYPNHSCLVFEYMLGNATTTPGLANLSCDTSTLQKDIWFSFIMPDSGAVQIQTTMVEGGLEDMVIALYSGTCQSLQLVACDDDSGDDAHAMLNVQNPAFAGQTMYLRVMEKHSDEEGIFGLCIFADDLPCSDESAILYDFYQNNNGPNWYRNSGWAEYQSGDCDICKWEGIRCNEQLKVVGLSLPANNIIGRIDSNIVKLKSLADIDLSENQLTDTLSRALFQLPKLKRLDLSHNLIQGNLHLDYSASSSLKEVYLSDNQLSGRLPYLKFGLDSVHLENNLLEGCFNYTCTNYCNGRLVMTGNTNLAYQGDLSSFCIDNSGIDNDNDGYCFNVDDCNDQQSSVYPGAPEICDAYDNDCDGLTDEGFQTENVFLGVDSLWNKSANWSLGMIPIACHNVVIGGSGESHKVYIAPQGQQGGSGESGNPTASTIQIGPAASLYLRPFTYLNVLGGHLDNAGYLEAKGSIFMQAVMQQVTDGIVNDGVIYIDSSASIQVQNIRGIGLHNRGTIQNNGSLSATSFDYLPLGNIGLKNESNIFGTGYLQVYGLFLGQFIQNTSTGTIQQKNLEIINLEGRE